MLGEQRRHAVRVGKVEFDEAKVRRICQLGAARVFQLRIVIGVEIVDADHGAAVFQQPLGDVKADKAGGAGDENRIYNRHSSTPSGFCARSSFDLTSSTMPSPPLSSSATRGQPRTRIPGARRPI